KAQSLQLQSGLIERIGSSGKAGGSLIYEADRSMYSVTYTVFKRLGKYWTYASVDSLEKINSPVVAASNFVYLFGGAGLLLAIAVAFLVSRKLYQPIHTLNKMFGIHLSPGSESADEVEFITEQWKHLNFQSRALEDRLQKQLPVMKEGFLLQLLQGHFQLSRPDELKERMQLFGWNTERPGYAVLGIQMTGSPQSKERFHKGDQELISFAAVNMVEEVLKDRELRSEIINLHDLSIGVILEYPPDESPDGRRNDLQLLAERLVDIIYQFLQMPTTLCISRPIETVTEIPQAWEEVNRLVRYRNLYDSKQVIQAEDFMPQLNDGIRYPFAAESELMQAIRNLDEKLAAQVLETFCSELEANTTKEYLFQQGLLQLLGNLRFGMLKAGYNPFETEPFSLQEELDRGIETSEIAALLRERVISPYIRKIRQESEDQDSRLKLTIERIVETIHSRYGNADLSLDMLADEHELTPLTLSKAFKKITGINFVTYVTDVRLNKSKQLLLETDCKINDIAEMVGYQPTYFNRIFKKSEGITPSRYREMMQVEGQRPEL
ncbi:helix-turn-helix domain-containing protein, partial [Paenibacillus sepulcri]|nr:helix-turn-helix domain-containing protein [Paenibacillus sepulcri]